MPVAATHIQHRFSQGQEILVKSRLDSSQQSSEGRQIDQVPPQEIVPNRG